MGAEIAAALPSGFEFYHLGQVELAEAGEASRPDLLELLAADADGVAFKILGDWQGWLVLVFDRGLDLPTYNEMGNVIASRFADGLARARGIDVLISPPIPLDRARAARGLQGLGPAAQASYLHRHGEAAIRLEALVFEAPRVQSGTWGRTLDV